jgi:prolyl-tRNA synthetase
VRPSFPRSILSRSSADLFTASPLWAVSPLLLTSDLVSKTQVILSASLAASSSLFAFHPETSASTVFLTGADLAKYLNSLGKVAEVDFEPVKSDREKAAADKKRKEDAKIEGADELAIGVHKELDFPEWYRRVLVKGEMIECVPRAQHQTYRHLC